ncbi:hypothetical protein PGT21_017387 [Puccinia graminis f. sp. tritici]|uniref:Uncharacterized protein n=1 Tax=Puccinia graminis f. sp. tritici TaxID=56615 RepID=A0A5B0RLB8_PUCGR|nr:hypothetical protein PGT21_017387 [Puccinia graminis f. sp. tritici]KAA1126082.1 hypothetical protein PGTUg99_021435 [Puccinia graminis f. sp. tritici]
MKLLATLMVQVIVLILNLTALSCVSRPFGFQSIEAAESPAEVKSLWKRYQPHKLRGKVTIKSHRGTPRTPKGHYFIIPPRLPVISNPPHNDKGKSQSRKFH